MAGWMLYFSAAATVFWLAGLLAARGLRQLGFPVRAVWASAMAATVLLPLAVAGAGRGEVVVRDAGSDAATTGDGAAGPAVWSRIPAEFGSSALDGVLLWGWIAVSLLMLWRLLVSVRSLRRSERSWRPMMVAGQPVLVSEEFGPAVVGALRPRIVLPSWVLDWDESHRQLIVMHEREHVRAGDSRLLLGSLVLLALVPWCLPVWWQFRRLREAIETDCDARLLAASGRAREYAAVLLAVAGRPTRRVLTLSTFAPAGAELERRLRLITAAAPAPSGIRGAGLLAAGIAVALGLGAVPVPAAPNLNFAGAPGARVTLGPAAAGDALPDWLLPDGSLPGSPRDERLTAEILAHHPGALAAGLPPESVIWFIAGDDGEVKRTGIERGSADEVATRVRSRFPAETSEAVMSFEGVPAGAAIARVVWLIPAPPFLTEGA